MRCLYHSPSSSGSGSIVDAGEEIARVKLNYYNETMFSGHNVAVSTGTHSSCDSMHKTCSRSRKTRSQHWEGGHGHKVPSLAEELLTTDYGWERGPAFFRDVEQKRRHRLQEMI